MTPPPQRCIIVNSCFLCRYSHESPDLECYCQHPEFMEDFNDRIIPRKIVDGRHIANFCPLTIHSSAQSEQDIREKVLEEVRTACIHDESAGYTIFRILQELRSKQGEP